MPNSRPQWSLKFILGLTFLVYALTVTFNTGFIATDEYWDGITRYLPAQKATIQTLIRTDDVKSPLQILPLHAAAQTAYKLGIESPFDQYHFVIIFWGLLGWALCSWASFLLFKERSELLVKISLLAFAFHFATPGLITRPMFEALSAPWIALSGAFAVLYDERKSLKYLLSGVVTVSVAFALRQQTGFCALVFMLLPILHKQWKHFVWAGMTGLACFILAGIPDIFLRGSFHHSLHALADYNFKHGANYGSQPWYFFFPLIFVFMMIPWLFAKYPSGFLKTYFQRYRSLLVMIGLFLVLHSMFHNKFERFLISMIPLMIFLMVPLIGSFVENWRERKWRLGSAFVFNFILWVPASFFPAQKNIIDLARYMDVNPQFNMLYNVDESFAWVPDAFMRAPSYGITVVTSEELQSKPPQDCNILIVVNANALKKNESFLNEHYKIMNHFNVNVIESIAYRLNPDHNVRRSPLTVFSCKD